MYLNLRITGRSMDIKCLANFDVRVNPVNGLCWDEQLYDPLTSYFSKYVFLNRSGLLNSVENVEGGSGNLQKKKTILIIIISLNLLMQ